MKSILCSSSFSASFPTKVSWSYRRRYWIFSPKGSFLSYHNYFSSKSSDTDTFQVKDTSWAAALSNSKNNIYHSVSPAGVQGFLKRERQTDGGRKWMASDFQRRQRRPSTVRLPSHSLQNTLSAKVVIQTWCGKPALHRPNEKCLQSAAGASVVVRHYDGWPILQSISSTALL